MALVATNTRVEEFPIEEVEELVTEVAIESGPHGSRAQLLSASTRLAVGLGLKGVLPCAGWAGLTDSPRRKNYFPLRVPRSRLVAGLDVTLILCCGMYFCNMGCGINDERASAVNFRPQIASAVPSKAC